MVVPTPIGNLEDMTLRALRELREVSLILAEDTRHTRKLLSHFGIKTPMLSYHQHNKRLRLAGALAALADGDVALVSDAGMPSIADPGFELIRAAIDADVRVEVLPGPSAVISAVVAAAVPAPGFVFLGFLSRRSSERRAALTTVMQLPYALVLYEAPHRLAPTLADMQTVLGNRDVVVVREMSKIHEEVVRGTTAELGERYAAEPPRGEITLVVAPPAPQKLDLEPMIREQLLALRSHGESARSAVSAVTRSLHVPRNDVYRLWLDLEREDPTQS